MCLWWSLVQIRRRTRGRAGSHRDMHKIDQWTAESRLTQCATAYWIAFGPHGPRALPPPGESTKIFTYTLIGVAASGVIFALTRHFAGGNPRTMTKEYQEATNEYFKVSSSAQQARFEAEFQGSILICDARPQENKVEPISGYGSEGYKGVGQVQSPPGPKE